MRKRWIILFLLLLGFGILVSSSVDWQHILAGSIVTLITLWFWQDLESRLPNILSFKGLLLLFRCIVLLIGYVIESNIAVAKTLLFSKPPVSPTFVFMNPGIKSNWGRILLATYITITPGTVTIDIDPETGEFIVHALVKTTAMELPYWRIIDEIKKIEFQAQRRANYGLDTSGTYDIDSPGTVAGDYGSNHH